MHNSHETDIASLPPKRRQIVADLAKQISAGALPAGSRLPSTRKLAAHYNVSLVTAHRASQDLEEMGLLERRDRSGTFVQQATPHPINNFAGLLFAHTSEHVWGEVTTTMVTGLQRHGLMTMTVSEDAVRKWAPDSGEDPLAQLVASQPLAMVMKHCLPASRLTPFIKQVGLWLCLEPTPQMGLPVESIAPDIAAGWRAAVNHLVALGHRRLAIAGLRVRPTRAMRLYNEDPTFTGYTLSMEAHGLEPLVRYLPKPPNGQASAELAAFLRGPDAPTAILCQTDWYAVELIRQCELLGIRVPDDVAFIGAYNTPWCETYNLTSIDYRYPEIAAACVERIVAFRRQRQASDIQQHQLFPPHLTLRGSTLKN